jgi:hypothetical protein
MCLSLASLAEMAAPVLASELFIVADAGGKAVQY